MNGDMQSTEAVGCKNTSIGEYSTFERSPRMSGGGRSASEYVDLSNANIGKNLMPQKPKGSFASDMKNLIGEAICRICQESFSTTVTALTEPIDIYSEWIDECARVNNLEDDGD
ncbi:Transcription elongation factor 1 -like protein [Capsicum annuum]|uniref:Transcription elongation factor 1 homolog n=1 Tax=Capsicum annuum TaxID=4072 RepID=A0A2G2YIQ0_CAPAN|nr:Transcription elongation factor 1 -like protein [Capsicum annuum]